MCGSSLAGQTSPETLSKRAGPDLAVLTASQPNRRLRVDGTKPKKDDPRVIVGPLKGSELCMSSLTARGRKLAGFNRTLKSSDSRLRSR